MAGVPGRKARQKVKISAKKPQGKKVRKNPKGDRPGEDATHKGEEMDLGEWTGPTENGDGRSRGNFGGWR